MSGVDLDRTEPATPSAPRKKVAALTTTYFLRSHADDFVTRLLEGYSINGHFREPPCDVASLYVDQIHRADISQRLSMAYGFPIVPSIEEALTLGSGRLAVDGVLLIAEHGDYPTNKKHQKLYPRHQFFEQVVQVFRDSGRSVPVFVDKQLSYDWNLAQQMYDWSHELGFPLLAGSALPVTYRRPALDLPLDSDLEEVLAVAGGHIGDGWLFHTLETLQCFAERRRGGESGVCAVQMIAGPRIWQAALDGRWDRKLLDAALACRSVEGTPGRPEDLCRHSVACFLEYKDGLRATLLALDGGVVFEYLAAMRLRGRPDPLATLCHLPYHDAGFISPLVEAFGRMLLTGQRLWPLERTLLTTGTLAFLMESGYLRQKLIETPELRVSYRAPEKSFYANEVEA